MRCDAHACVRASARGPAAAGGRRGPWSRGRWSARARRLASRGSELRGALGAAAPAPARAPLPAVMRVLDGAPLGRLTLLLLLLLLLPPEGQRCFTTAGAAGLDTPPPGTEFLVWSAKKGELDGVKKALADGVPVDAMNKKGWNALHVAAQNGHTEVVRALIDAGADVNIQFNEAWSPLAFAAEFANDNEGGLENVIALVDAGADPLLKDLNDYTAVMRADEGTAHHAVIKAAVGGWWAEKRKGRRQSKSEL